MRNNLTALGLALVTSTVLAQTPRPSLAPVSWELNFRYQDPQRVSVIVPGETKPVVYWYMLYSIENPTDREVEFYPKFELVTDRLQVIPSEIKVSAEAFRAIQRRSGDPLLLPPEKVVGKLLSGEDRARHSVAIWRDMSPQAREFTIYVSGLSGETKRVRNPVFDAAKPESEKNRRYYVLRKTLAVPYKLPGGASARTIAQPERLIGDEKWTMR